MKRTMPYNHTVMETQDITVVRRACRLLESDVESMPTLQQLASELAIPPARLHRAFKRIAGVSPRQYAQEHRLGKLKSRLRDGEPVSRAIYESGFGSSRSVYE